MSGDSLKFEIPLNDENADTIAQKHRRERKELQAKIQSLKKSASKGDKKKRKEILEEILKLEIDLEKRQSEQLSSCKDTKSIFTANKPTEEIQFLKNCDDNSNEGDGDDDHKSEHKISRAQKRRDKKASEEKLKNAEIQAQEELNKNGPRMLEMRAINAILKKRDLILHPIPSDGDCLYNAIRHQLELRGHPSFTTEIENLTQNMKKLKIEKRDQIKYIQPTDQINYLRNETAEYILNNKESLIAYMTNPETGNELTDSQFNDYCQLIRTTRAWGGQIEIKALANVLQIPIEVIQANGPPTIQTNDDNWHITHEPLTITYHRHMYSLGEHYNSTIPNPEAIERLTTENDITVQDFEVAERLDSI